MPLCEAAWMIGPARCPCFWGVCIRGCGQEGSSGGGGGGGGIGTADTQKVMGLIQDGTASSTMAREECESFPNDLEENRIRGCIGGSVSE